MATKEQYDFFRSLYEEEERTQEQLEGRAKVYLSIVSAFLAALLLKTGDVSANAKTLGIPWEILLIEALLFALALLFVVFALRIKAYEAVADALAIVEKFEGDGPTDAEFMEDRIADYAVAASHNLVANNQTASILAWAGRFLVMAMILLILIICYALRVAR
jgi:hypothetical protein